MIRRLRKGIRAFFVTVFPPLLAVIFFVWATRDGPPVEIHTMRLVGAWVPNVPGGEFTIHMEGVKKRDCPVVVREELIDSAGKAYILPLRIGVTDATGEFEADVKYMLPPEQLPDGITTFHSTAVYSPDYLNGCFKVWTQTSPARPDVRFWLGHEAPPWARALRR